MVHTLDESKHGLPDIFRYKVTIYLDIIVCFKLIGSVLSLIHTVHSLDAVRFFY